MSWKKLEDFTPEEINRINAEIDAMSHVAMAYRWQFSPSGDDLFRSDLPFFARFEARYKAFGGMTPEISKRIGWD